MPDLYTGDYCGSIIFDKGAFKPPSLKELLVSGRGDFLWGTV
jgi:hypothetical protein